MSRANIVLVSPPPLYDPRLWAAPLPCKPHLESLAGFVRDVAEVRVVDLELVLGAPASLRHVPRYLEGLERHTPLQGVDLVAISCWTSFHYLGAVAVADAVRKSRRRLPIVVGGHHATALPGDFTGGPEPLFDFVVRGDGEHALRALCEERPARPAAPRVIDGARFEPGVDGGIDWRRYPWHDEANRSLWVNLSRGCPFSCAFCAGRAPTRAYAVGEALDLLETLCRERAPERVFLADPLFGADRVRLGAFLDGLAERRLPLRFWAETRADLLDLPLLDRLHAAGFWLDFGLDAGSETMVRRLGKSRDPARYLARARRTLRHADAIGLPHLLYLLFHFPGETPETMRETMDYVEALAGGEGPVSGVAASQRFYLLPGTAAMRRLDSDAAELGTRVRFPDWWRRPGDHAAMSTDILPSAAFGGREAQLSLWSQWQGELEQRWAPRRPAAVQALYREAFGVG